MPDAWAVARVHVDSWRSAYAGLLPDELLAGLSVEQRAEAWTRILGERATGSGLLVLEGDGAVLGYCHYSKSGDHDADDATAELTSIYLADRLWRQGNGTRLLDEVVRVMARQGYCEIALAVDKRRVFAEAAWRTAPTPRAGGRRAR